MTGASAIRFTIPGRVAGKGRPRATIRAGHAAVYTPAKTISMEGVVRHFASEAMRGRDMLLGPVKLTVVVRINHTASWSKKRKAAAIYVTGRPDGDNCVKLIGDACNKILWRDDSQIAQIEFDRRYSDGPEFVEIAVHDLTAAVAA